MLNGYNEGYFEFECGEADVRKGRSTPGVHGRRLNKKIVGIRVFRIGYIMGRNASGIELSLREEENAIFGGGGGGGGGGGYWLDSDVSKIVRGFTIDYINNA